MMRGAAGSACKGKMGGMRVALTIAGSDSCGGAGIQADIKTMSAHGVYAMTALTALTAQSTAGVLGIMEVSPEFLGQQIDAVVTDIFPDAVKTGMIPSAPLVSVIAERVVRHRLPRVVVDPVMVATSGARLISEEAVAALKERLLPLAFLVTPNIPEAEILSGVEIAGKGGMEKAASAIFERYGCAVLVKGGHSAGNADDFLFSGRGGRWFCGARIGTDGAHGTGCTLSSAIASSLALGRTLEESVGSAKEYVSSALLSAPRLGRGHSPLNHFPAASAQ